jgi:hypothetical protein
MSILDGTSQRRQAVPTSRCDALLSARVIENGSILVASSSNGVAQIRGLDPTAAI